MNTRIPITETEQDQAPVHAALMGDLVASARASVRQAVQPLEWQALLLRYLPEPLNASHSIKRLALR